MFHHDLLTEMYSACCNMNCRPKSKLQHVASMARKSKKFKKPWTDARWCWTHEKLQREKTALNRSSSTHATATWHFIVPWFLIVNYDWFAFQYDKLMESRVQSSVKCRVPTFSSSPDASRELAEVEFYVRFLLWRSTDKATLRKVESFVIATLH